MKIENDSNKNNVNILYNGVIDMRNTDFIDYKNDCKNYLKQLETIKSEYYILQNQLTIIRETITKETITKETITKETIAQGSECSVCISNIKSHVIVPCGHKAICGDCSPIILQGGSCPICRADIESIIKVYEV